MAAAENEALVRRIFDAFARKQGFALRDVFAADAIWTVPGAGSMAGTFRGREEIFALPRPAAEGDRRHVHLGPDRRARVGRPRGRAVPGERRAPGSPPRARPGAALHDRGWTGLQRTRAAERSCSVRYVLGRMSDQRFADGLRYRIEIPSVEGPRVMEAVLAEADARGVPVRRISQGSGVMMLTDGELAEMARLGSEHGVEVSLFLGPRGAWDIGGQSLVTPAVGVIARGDAGVEQCLAEVRRGLEHGIRSYLVGDVGALATLGRMRAAGDLRPTSSSRRRCCCRARTAPPRGCCRTSVQRRSTSPPTSRPRHSARSAPPARRRSTSTSRCRTTRAGSSASTTCRS